MKFCDPPLISTQWPCSFLWITDGWFVGFLCSMPRSIECYGQDLRSINSLWFLSWQNPLPQQSTCSLGNLTREERDGEREGVLCKFTYWNRIANVIVLTGGASRRWLSHGIRLEGTSLAFPCLWGQCSSSWRMRPQATSWKQRAALTWCWIFQSK